MKPLPTTIRPCRFHLRCLALACVAGAAFHTALADVRKDAASPQDGIESQLLAESEAGLHRISDEAAWKDVREAGLPETEGTPGELGKAALSGTVVMSSPEKGFTALRPKSVAAKPTQKPAAAPRGATPPNFVFIVTDDQRWDTTGFMQERMASLGHIARFPHLIDRSDPAKPVSMTPNLDRLSKEGVHFDNGFCVYSLCSPSRSVMLTGLYPHRNGVTGNDQEFPVGATTYATLLRDAGWATGYFGKWHHGLQAERPGFTTQQSFRGQGHYFDTTFFDEKGTASVSEKWVDEQTTDYAIDFINTKHAAGKPFMAFLGLKAPHGPRHDKKGKTNAPAGFDKLFTDTEPTPVPNLLRQGAAPPPWKPNANNAGMGNDPRNYLRLISAADAQIGRLLDRLTALGIADNTVVIFVSDNGYFIGEHGLGDKRAAFEESLRIPFMIRYPALQAGGAGRIADEMVLNVDLAPTILDLAGLPVPAEMQGRSLRPLIENRTPDDWRESFFFSYTDDPEFPGSTADFIGVRHQDGRKLVRYAHDRSWDEFYQTSPKADQFELKNLIAAPAEASGIASLQARLETDVRDLGFIQPIGLRRGNPQTMEVRVGETYPYRLETSTDLKNWTTSSSFEGTGEPLGIDLVAAPPAEWDITVDGDPADHVQGPDGLIGGSKKSVKLGCGAEGGEGMNAVLVFELPQLPDGKQLSLAQLEVTARKNFVKFWDADLWAMGIKADASPMRGYHGTPGNPAPAGLKKLQDAFFDASLPANATVVRSSLASGLSAYLRAFYGKNPDYAGGRYLFLRINPENLDMSEEGKERYDVSSADSVDKAARPKLLLSFQSQTPDETRYWRIGYGRE
jgi:arylsulfatase A-like enzyme